jgi:3'-phosphoadenosine 5'-phosphosulfate sulfotransferase (PAPS reductase)/FAD synthetase
MEDQRLLTVSYFSAGVSSAVATKMMIGDIDRIMYTHIDDQHPDSMRFVRDCEKWFGKQVEIWQSDRFRTVDECCRAVGFICSPAGAACTHRLKRAVRKRFEKENEGRMRIIWGIDYTEKKRSERIVDAMPEHDHVFPLIEARMTKKDAHQALRASDIKRPAMYDLGYSNNNCIGCVKGGMGYWNHIRVDFPEVFKQRADMERVVDYPFIGKGVWLDELDPKRGRHTPPICDDCGIFCEILADTFKSQGDDG